MTTILEKASSAVMIIKLVLFIFVALFQIRR